jgi:hypothetical protein
VTNAIFWACIAIICLFGWMVTLIFLSKSILPMANALSALGKLEAHMDEQIRRVLERIQQKQGSIPNPPKVPVTEQKSSTEAALDAVRNMFGKDALRPIGEQPPSDAEGLEIAE